VVSPILSNIYLDRLDQFVETVLLPVNNRGDRRNPNPPYMALLKAVQKARSTGDHKKAKELRLLAQHMPSRDPLDPDFRRLWYVRYADDWLLGFSGPRVEAEAIKCLLAEFLREALKLELSQEKTLITNARTESARFLGYEIINLSADDKQHRALRRRCINGSIGLKVPVDVIRSQCSKYMQRGKPIQLAARIHDSDYSIVAQYQGFVQYYLMAFNVHRLWWLHRVMELSLAKTLADKFKLSVSKVFRRYKTTMPTPHGTLKVLEVIHHRGVDKEPLITRFGGIELRWQKRANHQ